MQTLRFQLLLIPVTDLCNCASQRQNQAAAGQLNRQNPSRRTPLDTHLPSIPHHPSGFLFRRFLSGIWITHSSVSLNAASIVRVRRTAYNAYYSQGHRPDRNRPTPISNFKVPHQIDVAIGDFRPYNAHCRTTSHLNIRIRRSTLNEQLTTHNVQLAAAYRPLPSLVVNCQLAHWPTPALAVGARVSPLAH